MIKPIKYARKPFYVDVVEVTEDNMEEVAKWCGGKVRPKSNSGNSYIKVRVRQPIRDRQTMAFPGDMVLKAGTGFRVYTRSAFYDHFEPVEVVDYDDLQSEKLFDPEASDAGLAESLIELRTVNEEA